MSTTFGSPGWVRESSLEVPRFEPHPWLADPHLQTIVARFLPSPRHQLASRYAEISLERGDRIAVLDSRPQGWSPGDPSSILVHGLGGCARSPYIVRVARKLVDSGIRVVRMNLRGAGSGFGASRSYYHSGSTDDLRAVAEWLTDRAPGSPIALVGFSLGANLVLKLAGEAADRPVSGLDCVVAANPPLDLETCCRQIQQRVNRRYDQNFLRNLRREVSRLHQAFPDLEPVDFSTARSLIDFDELYTAKQNGFASALDYYTQCSAGVFVPRIEVPGLVIHARDDPFIPVAPFLSVTFPPGLALELIEKGGHLGYFSRTPWRGDRRWLDARIATWLESRWGLVPGDASRYPQPTDGRS
jgi:predicted alpha/beta-fold hydrolase